MSNRFKGVLSLAALFLGFAGIAHAEEAKEEDGSFGRLPAVVLIECQFDSEDDFDYDVSSVTPSNFNPVSTGDDCAIALSTLTTRYGYDIGFTTYSTDTEEDNSYIVYTLQRNFKH
jgi:hypothetical protein